MSAKKIAKKTTAKKTNGNGKAKGYRGHRPGTAKEKMHQLYDKLGPEKARPLALKLAAASTVGTSFSQFKKVAGRKG